ncbi:MAG: MEKHLA domain-containing protein [Acidobacteria bacterium]|nr:MEKHLA domain-containing protein [Acidobacteriota bacterium]
MSLKAPELPDSQKQDLLQRFLDVSEVILVAVDLQGSVLFINQKGCEVLGYSPQEVLGKNWFDHFVPQEVRDRVRNSFQRVVSEKKAKQTVEFPILTRSGSQRQIEWHNALITDGQGKFQALLSSGADVTGRRLKEQQLLFLASMVESSDDAIIGRSLDGVILTWNRGAEKLYGYTAREMVGQSFRLIVPPDRSDEPSQLLEKVKAGELVHHYETQRLTKSGRLVDVALTVSAIRDSKGRLLGTSAIAHDITQAKKNAAELREREARLRAILDTVIDGVITIDERGQIQTFNPAAEQIFGYAAQEVIGKNVGILMPQPDRSRHDDYIKNYLATGQAKIIGIGREVTGRRKDGSSFPMHLGVGEMPLENGTRMFTGIIRDLTEIKQMEQEVIRSRELAALGEMAVSVAHQIRNPLAAICGVVQVLHENAAIEAPEYVVRDLLDRTRQLDQVVKRLLMFARPWKAEKQLLNLNDIVQDLTNAAANHETFNKIDFRMEPGPNVRVLADPLLIQELLWNLIYNSAHAMPEGGEIRFSTRDHDHTVSFSISDTGTGIPPEIRERLFRPFFTTKSRGSGLGLFICRKIMESHNGIISIFSEPGRGTEVLLEFPKE